MKNGALRLLALFSLAGLILFCAVQPSMTVVATVLALNTLALGCFALDKTNAQTGRFRIPEMVLHLLALTAGAGACVGRHAFRHKTLKPSFTLTTLAGAALLWAGFSISLTLSA